jgi:xanthine dehydrogenase small subunit
MKQSVSFSLNGEWVEVAGDDAGLMLADFLRTRRRLAGTKVVCAEGDCGACTVLKAAPYTAESAGKGPRYLPVNSCIIPVASLQAASVVTVDALAAGEALTPVQQAMVQCHGSQCGFCTPGFVMALTGLVEKKLCSKKESISPQEARNATTGNLCRCTGYQPILDAATAIPVGACQSVATRFESPAIRKRLKKAASEAVWIEGTEFRFLAPTRLSQLGAFLGKNRNLSWLGGGTDLGVVHNKRKKALRTAVSLHLIPELHRLKASGTVKTGRRLWVGARVTLAEVRRAVEASVPEFSTFLDLFASPQIKNQGTLIGNLANASPIGDTSPFLLVAGTVVHAYSVRRKTRRKIPVEQFFKGYRKTALKSDELILGIEFDLPSDREALRLLKVSQRKDLDISTISVALRIDAKRGVRLAMGGVGATPLRFPKTEKLLSKTRPESLGVKVLDLFHSEMTPLSDLRSSSAFRRVAAENLLKKAFREAILQLAQGQDS